MRVHIVTAEEIEGVEIAEADRVFISFWADLSRLYVVAECDCSSADTVYRHLAQDSLQLGVKSGRLNAAKKGECIATHYKYGVIQLLQIVGFDIREIFDGVDIESFKSRSFK